MDRKTSEEDVDLDKVAEERLAEDLVVEDDVDVEAASFIARRWYSSPIAVWSSEVPPLFEDAVAERITGGVLVRFTWRILLPDAGL